VPVLGVKSPHMPSGARARERPPGLAERPGLGLWSEPLPHPPRILPPLRFHAVIARCHPIAVPTFARHRICSV